MFLKKTSNLHVAHVHPCVTYLHPFVACPSMWEPIINYELTKIELKKNII
jgi:hypothetical protein